ncbi:beta-lactamase family protein [Vicingaceae bacterium]|nr:beta-lactamase family protein [Vicingaceae bacterium]
MKILKRILLTITTILVVASLLLIITGNTHLFKGISHTYLVGRTGPTINDHTKFENRAVEVSSHQPWEFDDHYNKTENKKLLTEIESFDPAAFVIVKNDKIIYEKYWGNYDENSLTNSFSMAKTFIGLLIGIAIDEGKINSVDDPVYKYLPQYKENPELTIKHLLTMSSGIDFDESYSSPFGHMAKAYYGSDIKKLNEDYTVTNTPGENWKYLGGNTIILSLIIEEVTRTTISEYMSKKVWQPIGAKNPALWSLDKKEGREKSYCCFYSNARDFAKIGKLYLNKGLWKKHRVISETYIKASMTPAYNLKDRNGRPVDFYGYQMWMNNYKGLEVVYARGILGQFIIIIPEKDIVIVRLGHERGQNLPNYHPTDFYTYIDFALEQ